jgi:putative phosphoribosyl transferase
VTASRYAGAGMREERTVEIPAGRVRLEGTLGLPPEPSGVVLFSHGTGSGRHSPRNRSVAAALREAGLATLLLDLLTGDEELVDRQTAELRFDIPVLAERLVGTIRWIEERSDTGGLHPGIFGASTGAAAALMAAAEIPDSVGAVVSRGGRPDLAGDALPLVTAPTLLIVGSLDTQVLELNREALDRMESQRDLVVVDGASHLFEEPGTLDTVARLAAGWFTRHLGAEG